VPSTPGGRNLLVDRRAQTARLDRLLADARLGTSAAVVVRGEAGIGKSALLDYVLGQAAGCRVVRSSGVESEMELAFAGLHQLCAPFLDHLERLPQLQREALATAFGLQPGAPPDRFIVGLAVLTLLADVAEAQPLICLVDDGQWLDRASAQVLGFVARRLAAESVVMLIALREPADNPDFANLPQLTVEPLEEPDARTVLVSAIPGPVDEPVRERILAEAAGNPLALLELPRGWSPAAFAGGFGLPDGVSVSAKVEESFRRRLSPLPQDTKRMLLVAAAEPIGDPALVFAAAAQFGIAPESAEPATISGLLEIKAQVRFRHPLVRSVVYMEAPATDRRLVHAALAKATDPAQEPDRRAWHLAAACAGPDEEVASELEQSAGRAQARGGVAAAAAFLQRAVELTPDPATRAERALAAAQATFLAGAFDAVQRLLATAEAHPLDGFQRARAALLRGQVAVVLGYGKDAPPLLLDAARQLEAFDPDLARGAYLTAYGAGVAAGHLGDAGVFVEICRSAERFHAAQGTEAPLDLLLEGLARMHTDGRAAAIPILQEAANAVAELPAQDVLRWGWTAPMAANALWDSDASTAIIERQARIVREAGALAELPLFLSTLAIDNVWTGDLAGAEALIAESDRVAAMTGSQLPPFAALRLRCLQGREAEASALVDGTAAIAETVGAGHALRVAQWAAAVLYNGLARYEDAVAVARQVTATDIDPYQSMWCLPELVEAASRTGETDLAGPAVERLAELTLPAGTDFALGMLARSRALLSAGDAAEGLYREAIERLSRVQLRPELARALLLYGEWLRREGRRVDAREELRTAYDLFVAIGMEAFAERARRELMATGETVRKRSVETQDQLTPQELQIAHLASEGHTNPEIGALLFLSRRTVEWHLRKVFDKLEIRSRRELPAALGRAAKDHTQV
jgi:DNA-binding CsgD family transcriptional regulator/tetratricopeptide (TPR) repeat protein